MVGWIGAGRMGLQMASRLLDAGYDVAVYNRTASKAAPMVSRGAVAVDTAALPRFPHSRGSLRGDLCPQAGLSGDPGMELRGTDHGQTREVSPGRRKLHHSCANGSGGLIMSTFLLQIG